MFYKDSKRLKNIELAIRHLQCCCSSSGSGGIQSIVAGDNISIDNTDPSNPIISVSGITPDLQAVLNVGNIADKSIQLGSTLVTQNMSNTAGNLFIGGRGDSSTINNIDSSIIIGYNPQVDIITSPSTLGATRIIGNLYDSTIGNNTQFSISNGQQNYLGSTGYAHTQRVNYNNFQTGRRNNMYAGHASSQLGGALISGSAFTTVVGLANEDLTSTITTSNTNTYNVSNPRFIVGTGSWNVVNNTGTRRNGFVVWSNGEIRMPQYGSGNFTGTPTYNLAVDSSGKVIEVATGDSFNLTVTDDDAVTASNIDTINFVGATVTDNGDGSVDVEYSGGGTEQYFVEITEGGNTGYGTKHRADNPDNYGDIGANAIDLSFSTVASSTLGARGQYSTISGGWINTASGEASTVSGGSNNTASGEASTVSGGASNTASGDYSTVSVGLGNTANSYGSWFGGFYSTIFTGQSATSWVPTDILFNIGNGPDGSSPSNALSLFKNGRLELPSYGDGTFTGTATKLLAVDADGKVIEEDLPSGGSSVTIGTDGQIPFTNSSDDDFDYSSEFTYDGALKITKNDSSTDRNITIVNSGTGDASLGLMAGNRGVTMGIDNSDSDLFKIAIGNGAAPDLGIVNNIIRAEFGALTLDLKSTGIGYYLSDNWYTAITNQGFSTQSSNTSYSKVVSNQGFITQSSLGNQISLNPQGQIKSTVGTSTDITLQLNNGARGEFSLPDLGNATRKDTIVTQTTQTVKQAKVTINALDFRSISSNPIEIVSAEGEGTIVNIIGATAFLDYNSTPFNFVGEVYLRVGNNPSWTMDNTDINGVADNYISFKAPTQSSSSVGNSPVVITSGSDSIGGDSDITIIVTYTVDDYN